jgi:hypothetical protein
MPVSKPPAKPQIDTEERSHRPAGSAGYTREDALADALERFRLPVLFTGLLALIGASRFEATRPLEAMFVALVVPLGALVVGAAPFKDSSSPLRILGFSLATVVLVLSEVSVAGALFASSSTTRTAVLATFVGLGVLAVFIEAAAARNGLKTRFSACVGIAAALAAYLPGHFNQKEALGTVLAALLIAVFAGGGAGLVLGAFATRVARRD